MHLLWRTSQTLVNTSLEKSSTHAYKPFRQKPALGTLQHRRRAAVHQLASHDDSLNLTGALPDSLYAQLPIHPLGHVPPHVTAPAEDLHGPIRDSSRHLRAVQLGHRGLCVQGLAVDARIDRARHLVEHR